ncbi:hypothetical protein ES703_98951 [subsurface metagenome]
MGDMDEKRCVCPANKLIIDEETLVDDLPSIKLWGRRFSDGKEGWFYFSPIIGSYHSILPKWAEKGDEVEFFEQTAEGDFRSLLLPGIKVASGSVSRILLEDGNIDLFSNIAGVHQTFHLVKPKDLEKVHEIIVDTVYLEEPCPKCGSANVFHLSHVGPPKSYSKCLNCGYDWKGKIQSELILVKKKLEEIWLKEVERHPHLREILLNEADSGPSPDEKGDIPPGV